MKRIYFYLLLILSFIGIPIVIKNVFHSNPSLFGFLMAYLILNIILFIIVLKYRLLLKIIFGVISLPIAAIFTFLIRKIDLHHYGITVHKSLIVFFFLGLFSVLVCEFFHHLGQKKNITVR